MLQMLSYPVKFGLQNGATLVTTCDSFGQPGAKDDAPFADAALSHERVVGFNIHVGVTTKE